MQDSVFTKIIRGEIPAEIIFEDDHCFVMLTIEPMAPGHLLVIPREQIDHLWDVDDETYLHLTRVAKQMAELLRKTYDYKRIGSVVEGFGVPHAHIHLFGLNDSLEQTTIRHAATGKQATPNELKIEADKLRSSL